MIQQEEYARNTVSEKLLDMEDIPKVTKTQFKMGAENPAKNALQCPQGRLPSQEYKNPLTGRKRPAV